MKGFKLASIRKKLVIYLGWVVACAVTHADVDQRRLSANDSMVRLFKAWDIILSSARRTDGAILCVVYDTAKLTPVKEILIGQFEVPMGNEDEVLALGSYAKASCETAIKRNNILWLNMSGAPNPKPGYVCVIRHLPQKRATALLPIGFSTRDEALAFATTYESAARTFRKAPER